MKITKSLCFLAVVILLCATYGAMAQEVTAGNMLAALNN